MVLLKLDCQDEAHVTCARVPLAVDGTSSGMRSQSPHPIRVIDCYGQCFVQMMQGMRNECLQPKATLTPWGDIC